MNTDMKFITIAGTGLAAALTLVAPPLAAQTTLSGNHRIQGNLCVGSECSSPDNFDSGNLKLRTLNNAIVMEDASTTATYPSNDWRLRFNDSNQLGASYFAVEDLDTGNDILRLDAGAPSASMHLDAVGRLGLGTTLPGNNLHIEDSLRPGIRLSQNASAGQTALAYDIDVDDGGLNLRGPSGEIGLNLRPGLASYLLLADNSGFYVNLGRDPDSDLKVMSAPVTFSLVSDSETGNIGVGTSTPSTGLHVSRSDGNGALLIEESSAGALGQLTLRNNGITYFTLEDTSIAAGNNTGRAWNFQNQAGTFRVTTAPGGPGEIEMQLDAQGDMYLKGQLYTGTGGATTTCAAGCDRVLDATYPLPSIAEHAADMKLRGHLPAVGPTPENGPFNLSQMTGGMLNELEKAHLYIAQLEERTRQIPALLSRLDALEAALAEK